jgi:hypothetical protein
MPTVTKRTRATLESMRLPDLQQRFAEITGHPTRSPNKTFLVRSIIEAMETAPNAASNDASGDALAEQHTPVNEAVTLAESVEGCSATEQPADQAGGSKLDVDSASNHEPDPEVLDPPTASSSENAQAAASPDAPAASPACAPETVTDAEPREMTPIEAAESSTEERERDAGDEHPSSAAPAEPERVRRPARGELTGLTIEELQARYLDVVGRPTGSADRGYLVWKIREAMKGKIPTGPRSNGRRASHGDDMMVLPLRLPASTVDAMDQAWQSRGIRTRMDFLRDAIRHHLERLGADEVAALLAQPATDLAREAL